MTDEPFVVTFFTDYAATTNRREALTLKELAGRIAITSGPTKERLPWLKCASFGDVRTAKGSLRHDANMLAISGVEVDYDLEQITVERAIEILEKAGLEAIVYTSPSHMRDGHGPRWRVLCPLSKEYPPEHREHLVCRLAGLFRDGDVTVLAVESFTRSQAYYFGAVDHNPEHRVKLIQGEKLDQLDELDLIALGKPASKSTGRPGDTGGPADEDALLDQLVSGVSYHTAAVRLLGLWARRGVPMMEAERQLRAAFDAVVVHDQRWRDRVAEIPRLLDDIWGREARKKDATAEELSDWEQRQPAPLEDDADIVPPSIRPVVEIEDGRLPQIVDQVEALILASDREIYEFGDQVVRPAPEPIRIADKKTVIGLRLVPISAANMVDRLTRAIDFRRYDMRSKRLKSTNCPQQVATTYLARVGGRRLRKLTALATAPVLRPDGTILERPGWDAATGILYDPRGISFPAIPKQPSREQAAAALAALKLLFYEFPFIDDGENDPAQPNASRSVLLSALLCSVARLAFPFAPAHAFDAPAAGTGKSKLVNCCAILATGYECPVASQGKDKIEMEKRLGAMLLAGDRIISLDNCEAPLGGQLLCQMITQGLIRVRVLGESRMVTIPNNVLLFATGNNLRLIGDMLRRGLVGRLDAGVERPELREFAFEDPEITLKRERGKYVTAALTVLRAYIVADRPKLLQPLGGFEDWSRLVREPLIWLGEADPVTTIERAREDDPQRLQLEAVLAQWDAALGSRRVSAKEVIEASLMIDTGATTGNRFLYPEFRLALMAIAGNRGRVESRRLGGWLRAQKGKVIGDRRIVIDGVLEGVTRWRLQHQTNQEWE